MLGEHFFGVAAGGFCDITTTRHAGNFVDAFGKAEGPQL
jgi:hypothetical protein